MFQLTQSELQRLASATGFQKNALEKFLRLLNILATLERNPLLRDFFVLKGGTALNLFHHGLLRLSVDIDLNYVHQLEKERMFQEKPVIGAEMDQLFSSAYNIAMSKDEHALTQFAFHYRAMSGANDMLKVEINYLQRLPILPPEVRSFQLYGIELNFPCLAVEELLAGKIVALLSRYTPRDLFDVYQAATSSWHYNPDRLRWLVLFYGLISRGSVFDLFQMDFERMTQSDLRRHLTPLLAKGQAPERSVMVAEVEKFLQPLLVLTPVKADLIKTFYANGILAVESLFSDLNIQRQIKMAPALLWKTQHIQSHKNKRATPE